MHDAAVRAEVPPDRLSFVNAVRILRNAVFEFQFVAESQKAAWYYRLRSDIRRERLIARDNRCNPYVVKRKRSNFGLKREAHFHRPQPTKPVAEAVVNAI